MEDAFEEEEAEAEVLSARASNGAAAGVASLTRSAVRWRPDDPAAAEARVMQVADITGHKKNKGPKPMLRLTTGEPAGEQGAPAADAAAASAAAPPSPPLVLQFLLEPERDRFSEALSRLQKGEEAVGDGGAAAAAQLAAARAAQLATQPELRSLHERLVTGGVLSEEDFWAANGSAVQSALAQRALGQRAGLSNALLASARAQQDGKSKKVNFRLSREQMASILAEDPAVLRAYSRLVLGAGGMSDKEFWTKYCRVQYLKQARKGGAAQGEEEAAEAALFAPDLAAQAAALARRAAGVPASVNLAASDADAQGGRGRGLGWCAEAPPSAPTRRGAAAAEAAASAEVKRELNRHGMAVLDGVAEEAGGGERVSLSAVARAAQARAAAAAAAPGAAPSGAARECEAQAAAEGVADLQPPPPPALQELRIADARRYTEAARATGGRGEGGGGGARVARWAAAAAGLGSAPVHRPALPPALALAALGDVVGPAGSGAGGAAAAAAAAAALPPAVARTFAEEARAASELLRHYWAAPGAAGAPPRVAAERAAKRLRVRCALAAVYDKLLVAKEGLPAAARHLAGRQLRPLLSALDASFEEDRRRGEAAVATAAAAVPQRVPQPSPPPQEPEPEPEPQTEEMGGFAAEGGEEEPMVIE